jgi:hypothetical protein
MKTIVAGWGIVDYAIVARMIEIAPWPIQSADVLTA